MATNYLDMLDAVKAYYGAGSDQWMSIAQYGVTDQNWQYLTQVPGVDVTISNSGKFLGYDYSNPFPAQSNPISVIDSNVQTGSYGVGAFNANVPSSAVVDQQTGLVTTIESGAKISSSGVSLASVADKVGLGIAGVALGTKLGALIDGAIYSIDPNWWDEHYPTINPNTWDDIIGGDSETGKWVVRSIFGLADDSDDTTMYLDERMLAYTYAMLLDAGVWNGGGTYIDTNRLTPAQISELYHPNINYNSKQITNGFELHRTTTGITYIEFSTLTMPMYNSAGNYNSISFSNVPFTYTGATGTLNASAKTRNGITYYVAVSEGISASRYTTDYPVNAYDSTFQGVLLSEVAWDLAYIYYHGGYEEETAVEGISPSNPEASTNIIPSSVINVNTGQPITPQDNIDDILDALKLAYPSLFANEIYEDIIQPDGTIDRITYVPTPYPNTENPEQPITDTTEGIDPQQNPEINPETRPESELQGLTNQLTQTTSPPATGDGATPPIVPVIGSASSLWRIYNPSQAQVDAFGAWLWTDNFIEQVKKLFNNPMEAIIGIHKVFATPSIGGTATIKCGYLDSGVSSNWVSDQYSHVNCGTVNLNEYFGNVFDYAPYTRVHLYLPFIGIVELDTADVMRASISITYHVDVITGACLAEIYVNRDGGGGVIYQYCGSAIVTYPLTSGNYAGAIAGVLSIVGGIAGTIVSGGALAPVAIGAISGAAHLHSDVQKSGGFAGCAGAMGIKIPYLIISRPQTALADNFPHYTGLPANSTVTLNLCSGHTRVKSVYTEEIPQATHEEKIMIEQALKSGVLI